MSCIVDSIRHNGFHDGLMNMKKMNSEKEDEKRSLFLEQELLLYTFPCKDHRISSIVSHIPNASCRFGFIQIQAIVKAL